jgi:glycosyltransferase involved in cell wall biosynthesis
LALLNALRRARRIVPAGLPVRAVIVGDGRLRPVVAAWNKLRGTSEWVELAGRLSHSEIRTLYRHADFFVAPAQLESFGIAALEARCAGLPIVALAGTGIQAFVRDGHDGLIADGDRDLGAAIARLVCDDDSRTMMAACAIECVAPFSWDVVLKQTDEEYERAQRLCAGLPATDSTIAESTITRSVRHA